MVPRAGMTEGCKGQGELCGVFRASTFLPNPTPFWAKLGGGQSSGTTQVPAKNESKLPVTHPARLISKLWGEGLCWGETWNPTGIIQLGGSLNNERDSSRGWSKLPCPPWLLWASPRGSRQGRVSSPLALLGPQAPLPPPPAQQPPGHPPPPSLAIFWSSGCNYPNAHLDAELRDACFMVSRTFNILLTSFFFFNLGPFTRHPSRPEFSASFSAWAQEPCLLRADKAPGVTSELNPCIIIPPLFLPFVLPSNPTRPSIIALSTGRLGYLFT